MCSSNSRRRRGGFTLIELMVSIVVIATLLSLALPAYYAVQSASLSARCKSNLSAIGKAYMLYAADHASRLPTYNFERDPDGVIREELFIGPWGAATDPEFHYNANHAVILPTDQTNVWSYPLRTYLNDEPENAAYQVSEIVACPTVFRKNAGTGIDRGNSDPISLGAESYFQSPALFTEIPAWGVPEGVVVNRDYAPVSLAAVAHPSKKTLLVETTSYHDGVESAIWEATGALFNVLATDGHVAAHESVLTERATSMTGLRVGGLPCSWCEPTPLLTTTGGATGTDW